MRRLSLDGIRQYVSKNIVTFHEGKLKSLSDLDLKKILRKKNPYLFRAKDITVASDFVKALLDAFLSSSEEKLFGDFLEGLAIFVATETCGGWKSSAPGIDLEFKHNGVHYLISIKSGPNWGNSSQYAKLDQDFDRAVKVLKQSRHTRNVQPVLGICYGRSKTSYRHRYMKVMGQNFWYLISDNEDLYKKIIEPLGHKAKKHNDKFLRQKNILINELTERFFDDFCVKGVIHWQKIVEFNSANLDLKI